MFIFGVVVEGMYTCKTGHFGNEPVFLYFAVVEGMYTCNTGHFVNEPLCLYLCCSVG